VKAARREIKKMRENTRLLLALPALSVLVVASTMGCALNPVSGKPEVALVSVEQEREIGKEQTKKLEKTVGFVQEGQVPGYVEAIGQRLVKHSPRQDVKYGIHVVDMPEPNAFALPGGYVFVTRGLLTLFNSEDELANVLGHEIGHVAARHSVQRASRAAPFAIATGLSSMAVGIVSPGLGQAVAGVGGLAGGVVLAPYSRNQEREADRIGQEMAAAAGWDPAGMGSFLERLEREAELHTGKPRKTSFLDTHPSTGERVSNTASHAASLTPASRAPIAANQAAFLRKLDGIRVGADVRGGFFKEGQFFHPDLDFALYFPEGWQTQNARSYVAAQAPRGKAVVVVEVTEKAANPIEASRIFQEQTKATFDGEVERLTINGLRAAHGVVQGRQSAADLTWIAHRGRVFQIAGLAGSRDFKSYRQRFLATAQSFRPLTTGERATIKDTRLRVVSAREGETLASLVQRTGSSWSVEQAAVSNGLDANAALGKGQLVKLAIPEPYVRTQS
jgi:predicted Zn-dependent protease